MNPKFHNRPLKFIEDKKTGEKFLMSRPQAVACVIIGQCELESYVLAQKRGNSVAVEQGKWAFPSGFLDWNETGTEAAIRETWEETGINLKNILEFHPDQNKFYCAIHNDLDSPWRVDTEPIEEYGQTVVLYYGLHFMCNDLPTPSLDYVEHPEEVDKVKWIPINKVCKKNWAFDHDKVFDNYYVNRICGVNHV